MTNKSYIFGTGIPAKESESGPAEEAVPVEQNDGFAMPVADEMAADAPGDAEAALEAIDFSGDPDLLVVDDMSGHNPYDTQTLPSLDDPFNVPGNPARRHHSSSDDEPNPYETQVLPDDLLVTEFDEDSDPYNTTGRFEARNIWRKVLRK